MCSIVYYKQAKDQRCLFINPRKKKIKPRLYLDQLQPKLMEVTHCLAMHANQMITFHICTQKIARGISFTFLQYPPIFFAIHFQPLSSNLKGRSFMGFLLHIHFYSPIRNFKSGCVLNINYIVKLR